MLKTEKHFISNLLYYSEEPEKQRELIEGIKPKFFEDERCREIARICCIGYQKKDILTIEYVEQNGFKLENSDIDFPITLTDKIAMQTKEALIKEYQERETKLKLSEALKNGTEIEQIITDLREIQDLNISTKAKSTDKLFQELKESFFTKRKSEIKFMIPCLDADVKLSPGCLFILGGYTGSGKSALALQFARAFSKQGAKTLYFNFEMSEKQILERLISAENKIILSRLSNAESFLGKEEKDKFESFENKFDNLKICSGAYNISKIFLEVRRNLPKVVIIDYLQLVSPGDKYKGNRVAEVSEISHKLKALAMELEIPVIALSQLNRESQKKSEPSSSDLRECGDLENDASVVLLLWNDDKAKDIKNLKVSKNRQGTCGSYKLDFEGKYMTFAEHWDSYQEEDQAVLPFTADKEA